MTPIWDCLKSGNLPENKYGAMKLCYKAWRYVEYDVSLYHRGFYHSLLKCLSEEEGDYVSREMHRGICGNHTRGNSFASSNVLSKPLVFYYVDD